MNASLQLLRDVLPSVVHLRTAIPEEHLSARILGTERMGSGTLVASEGLVLTVNYVVLGASRVDVTLLDGTEVRGEVIAQDFQSGIAVISIPGSGYRAAPLRSSADVQPGEEVFIVASVGGEGRRANSGTVTSLEAFDAYWEYILERSIRCTIANPGFGGGPMVDRLGRVIGAVSLNLAEVGKLSLAIPAERYLEQREELLHRGAPAQGVRRAWIGLFCHTLNGHVVIAGLLPGGPGDRAGLRPGDVILAVGDLEISDRPGLYRELWRHEAGERLAFRVFRDSGTTTVDVEGGSAEELFS